MHMSPDQLFAIGERQERADGLLARSHALLEMTSEPPRTLLAEIASHLGWAQEDLHPISKGSEP